MTFKSTSLILIQFVKKSQLRKAQTTGRSENLSLRAKVPYLYYAPVKLIGQSIFNRLAVLGVNLHESVFVKAYRLWIKRAGLVKDVELAVRLHRCLKPYYRSSCVLEN